MFETYKIQFSNRESFNKAQPIICNHDSLIYDDYLDVGHSDMIFTFDNIIHYKSAISRLKDKNIVDFQ